MKAPLLFLVIFALALAGCERGPQAPYEPDEQVVIQGTFVDGIGDPLESQWVGFWINSPESFFTNHFGLDPEENTQCDENGHFEEDFMGENLMDALGATFKVGVMNYDPSWPDTIPHVLASFFPLDTEIEVPELALWDGNPSSAVVGPEVTFSWDPILHELMSPDRYTFRVKATQDGPGYNMWVEDVGDQTSITLPTYALPENFVRKWHVVAHYEAASDQDFGFDFITRPDDPIVPDAPLQLLSLGSNCHAEAFAQPFTKGTDGKWGPWPTFCVVLVAANVSWVYVDLGETNTVEAWVAYGLTITGNPETPGFSLFVSDDTGDWGESVAENDQRNGYFVLDGFSAQGRYVKLQARDENVGITGFREVCVFGPE